MAIIKEMLKTIFNCKFSGCLQFACCLLVLLGGTRGARSEGEKPDGKSMAVQRVAQMVDYVAADYAGAVRDGQVLQASEYDEQRELLGEARKLVPELSGSEAERAALAGQLAEVVQAVEAKAAPDEVQRRCRTVRSTLKAAFHLRMVPTGDVDAARGAMLYGTLCASCHGATGHADTPTAATLNPRPLSFHDGERMVKVAPSLAYHTLTFGITGTAMAPFDRLPTLDRWHLAFYVVALRHGQPGAAANPPAGLDGELLKRLAAPAVLAELSDEELGAELSRAGVPAASQAAALVYLRTSAPFTAAAAGKSRFERARTLVAESLAAARGGDFAAAHRLAIAAYLDGVEPHEASLRIEHPELLTRIESAFAALRQASEPGPSASLATINRQAQVIGALLADAEQLQSGNRAGGLKAFLASLVIALREGIEVALLIAALLAFLRKSGQAALARSVHIGWLLSVPAGLVTFLLVGKLIDGAHRELAEGILTLVAAAILLSVTHWVLGAKEARHWLGFLRRRVEAVGQGGGQGNQGLWLAGIAFFAAYREALETALFYRALLLDVGPEGWRPVLLGIGVGVCALAVLVVVVGRIGRKLNPRPVMLASSALLAMLALALTGHGIHALQEGGYVGMTLIMNGDQAWSALPSLGIYPTWQGLGGQMLALVLLLVPSVLGRIRPTRSTTTQG